jgi:hypothetical protein
MRAGTRYLRHSPELQTVLVRSGIFVICASALWALLPQQARRHLGLGSFGYGLLLVCIGFGALVGAWLLPKVRERLSTNQLVAAGTVVFALSTPTLHAESCLLESIRLTDTPKIRWGQNADYCPYRKFNLTCGGSFIRASLAGAP